MGLIFLGQFIPVHKFPEDLRIRTDLYVRKAYEDLFSLLYDTIVYEIEDTYNQAIRITGTPGMGKSYFLGYVWLRLIKKFHVVVTVGDATITSCKDGSYEDITGKPLDDYLKRDVIYLVDPKKGGSPDPSYAKTVLFVSPSKERVGDFKRVGLINFYMPPWNKSELQICMKKFDDVSEKRCEELFEKWGGSMRIMRISAKKDTSVEEEFRQCLSNQCLLDIINQMNSDYLESYQWLVHRIPIQSDDGAIDYQEYNCDFPSRYIAEKVAERIHHLQVDWKTVGDSSLLGKAYECHVLKHLFQVSDKVYLSKAAYEVGDPEKKAVYINAVRHHEVFSNQGTIDPKQGTLYIPLESNKAGIDFVMPPWVFQVTISASHSAKRLDKVLNQFPSVSKWKICFIVPSSRIDGFKTPQLSKYDSITEKYKLPFDFGNAIFDTTEQ